MRYFFITCAILSIVSTILLATIDVSLIMILILVPIALIGSIVGFCGFFALLYHKKEGLASASRNSFKSLSPQSNSPSL